MGRKSIFPNDEPPEYDDGISKERRRQIRNRRHYLRYKERIKFFVKLYYRTHKQQQVEGRRRWKAPGPEGQTYGPLSKGDKAALEELRIGQEIYQQMKDRYYEEIAANEIRCGHEGAESI